MTQLLPLGHQRQIESLPHVRAVCAMRWFGGHVPDNQTEFPTLAVDADTMTTVFEDFTITPDVHATWLAERNAAILGAGLARRLGCATGDRVSLRIGIPPFPLAEFRIAGISTAPAYPNEFVARLDYLLDTLRASGMTAPPHNDGVNFYWIKADSEAALEPLRSAIDAVFDHTPDPTMTELEEAFVTQFTRMFGDIPGIVRAVGLVVIISILVIVAHTMSISIRERMGELAVLKAIGFTTTHISAALAGEALLIGLMGGLLGCVPAVCLFGVSAAGLSVPYFPVITVSPTVAFGGIMVGLLIGLLAAAMPVRHVAKLSVAAAVRSLA